MKGEGIILADLRGWSEQGTYFIIYINVRLETTEPVGTEFGTYIPLNSGSFLCFVIFNLNMLL